MGVEVTRGRLYALYFEAVNALALYFYRSGHELSGVVHRRSQLVENREDFEDRVLPALEEYGPNLPKPLAILMRHPPWQQEAET